MTHFSTYRNQPHLYVQSHTWERWFSLQFKVQCVQVILSVFSVLSTFSSSGMDSSLMSNIQKLFYERIEVFGAVEFNKLSIVTGIVKIALKVQLQLSSSNGSYVRDNVTCRHWWSALDCARLVNMAYSRCRLMHTTYKYTCGDMSLMSSEQ